MIGDKWVDAEVGRTLPVCGNSFSHLLNGNIPFAYGIPGLCGCHYRDFYLIAVPFQLLMNTLACNVGILMHEKLFSLSC